MLGVAVFIPYNSYPDIRNVIQQANPTFARQCLRRRHELPALPLGSSYVRDYDL
jgi:hypothetical protein